MKQIFANRSVTESKLVARKSNRTRGGLRSGPNREKQSVRCSGVDFKPR
jgi:hypothetical protein